MSYILVWEPAPDLGGGKPGPMPRAASSEGAKIHILHRMEYIYIDEWIAYLLLNFDHRIYNSTRTEIPSLTANSLWRIYSTLPTTSASCEQSFSKLKLIKNYLRSSMSQERLSSLAILAIENRTAHKLNYDKAIHLFAEQKD